MLLPNLRFAVTIGMLLQFSCTMSQKPQTPKHAVAFPSHEAKWTLRGTVSCNVAMLQASIMRSSQFSYPARCYHPNRKTIGKQHLLADVIIEAFPTNKKWTYKNLVDLKRPMLELAIEDKGVRPHTVYALSGDKLRIRNDVDKIRYSTGFWATLNIVPQTILHFTSDKTSQDKADIRVKFDNIGAILTRSPVLDSDWYGFLREHDSITLEVRTSGTFQFSVFTGKYRLELLDHPLFATTDKQGRFTFPGLPPAEYMVQARHPVLGQIEQVVTITDRNPPDLSFHFLVPKSIRAAK